MKGTTARAFFDAVARRYDRDFALSGKTSRERLARVVAALRGRKRVLVLGLGTGRELPALLDAGHDVVGLDVSPGMLAECNKRARTVPVVVGDFWDPLPFAAGAFDAAIALHGTLAHPPLGEGAGDLAAAVVQLGEELARVLTDDGVLVFEVPAAEGLARIAEADAGMQIEPRLDRARGSRFVHEDAAGLAIAGTALLRAEWPRALGARFDVVVEPLGDVEHLVLAVRRAHLAC
jgi:SAM-dependent methyltransferase